MAISRCRTRRQASGALPPFPAHQRPAAPPEVLERGKTMYASMCSACHGADARGGQLGGVNLLRSPECLGDRDGELVLPIVKNGRPGTAMAAMPMPDDDIKAIVAFLHSLQAAGQQPGRPPPGPPVELNILVGDAKAGARVSSPPTCASCHSTSGDLAGIASRVPDAKSLQNLWVSGGRASGRGPGRRRRNAEQAATVKVTLPHEVRAGPARAHRRLPGHRRARGRHHTHHPAQRRHASRGDHQSARAPRCAARGATPTRTCTT